MAAVPWAECATETPQTENNHRGTLPVRLVFAAILLDTLGLEAPTIQQSEMENKEIRLDTQRETYLSKNGMDKSR